MPMDDVQFFMGCGGGAGGAAGGRGAAHCRCRGAGASRKNTPCNICNICNRSNDSSGVCAGVEVEVVVPPAAAAPRIADAEELAPMQLFQQYVEARSVSPEVWLCSLKLTSRQARKHPPKRQYIEACGPSLKVFRCIRL